MTDVKLIFERVLETTAPPMTPAAQTLDAARRSAARRRAGAAAASALAACGVAAVVAVPLMLHTGAGPAATAGGTPTATAPTEPTVEPTSTPSVAASTPYEQTLLSVLLASIPDGYTLPTSGVVSVGGTNYQVQGTQVYTDLDGSVYYTASTDVYLGEEVDSVSVHAVMGPGAMPVVADLCSVPGPLHQGTDDGCQVATASGGVPVRLSYSDKIPGRVYYAAVAYPGVTVYTQEAPFGGMLAQSPMDPPVFGPTGLVELAANPGFRPPA